MQAKVCLDRFSRCPYTTTNRGTALPARMYAFSNFQVFP